MHRCNVAPAFVFEGLASVALEGMAFREQWLAELALLGAGQDDEGASREDCPPPPGVGLSSWQQEVDALSTLLSRKSNQMC